MPLVEPTNSLLKKMLVYGIDGLLLQVTNLPRVYKNAILPSALSTLACEIDTHQFSHTFGEDLRGFCVRLAKEKIPISIMLRLVDLAAPEQQGFFKHWIAGVFALSSGVTAESHFTASLQQEF